MRANPRGPKDVFAKDCVATAPLPACAHGTTAPTAGNFDATATPQACSSRSQATMEKVIKPPCGDYIVRKANLLSPLRNQKPVAQVSAWATGFNYSVIELSNFYRHFQHLIDQAVIYSGLGFEIIISVAVALDYLKRLAGVLGQDTKQQCLQPQDLLGLNFDVSGLALGATEGLVHVDGCIRQGIASAFC